MNIAMLVGVRTRIRLLFVVGILLGLSLAAVPGTAHASFQSHSKWSGKSADAWWIHDEGPSVSGPNGNHHFGSIYAYETTKGKGDAYAFIEDWQCDEGEVPGWYDPEDPTAPEGFCDFVGYRFGEGYGLSFVVAKKLASAHLVGAMTFYSGDYWIEGSAESIDVDITWTGDGDVQTSSYRFRYRSGGESYSETSKSNWRPATVDGSIGSMGFDPASSGGAVTSFSGQSKSRSK